ncbi:MAG: acyltransferase [Bdellovibrionaceae bacterium]|nr:acyltransferase [Pseudobdellovibrionaceae bacterium]NUM57653.1 DoxX family membrane protein [Pseudobdellovibrionaceae bacterium]
MNQKVTLGLRILLGLIFTIFGLNGFLNFLPQPQGMPEGAIKLAMAFVESGYLMTLIKGTEVVVGLLLLSGFFVPLALVVLAPIVINIFLFHAFLAPGNGGMIMPTVIIFIQAALAYQYKDSYRSILKAKG